MLDEGWDNFIFLIGEHRAARLPRRQGAVPFLLNEQQWLPVLAPRLPIELPLPLHTGRPSELFPWPWSVVTWIQGRTAETHLFSATDTVLLAETLLTLHQPCAEDAPYNPFRGVPLQTKNEITLDAVTKV